MKLLDPNSPFMDALRKLSDIIFCNMMFCLFSLPIFTIGASLSALFSCTQSLVDETEDPFIIRQFWRAFRRNFKQATLLWLMCLAAFAFLGVYYVVTGMLGGILSRVYRMTFFLLAIIFLFGFQYLFPMQTRFPMKSGQLLKNAWLLSAAALPWTLCSIAVPALAVYLSFFMNPSALNLAVFLWAFLMFGIIAYINSFFFRQAFKRVEPAG